MVMITLACVTGCGDTEQNTDDTVRDVTGANMIEQGRGVQDRLHEIDQQQQQRFEQLDQQ